MNDDNLSEVWEFCWRERMAVQGVQGLRQGAFRRARVGKASRIVGLIWTVGNIEDVFPDSLAKQGLEEFLKMVRMIDQELKKKKALSDSIRIT